MYKDIWNLLFLAAHIAVVVLLALRFGVLGTLGGIWGIYVFWFLKSKLAPNLNLWPDRSPNDVGWPEPLKAVGKLLAGVFGWIFLIAWGLGMLGSLSTCGSSSSYETYEPRAR
jgi:hypothetical protein